MKSAFKLWVVVAVAAIAYTGVPEAPAAAMGSIRGVVKDGHGNPLPGVTVAVLAATEEAKVDKVVKRSSTDREGKFVASGIVPGQYRLKAEAEGFSPVELAAKVIANKTTIFDSILLRQVSLLSEQTRLDPDPKYSARRARSSVLHFEETTERSDTTSDEPVVLTGRSPEVHGVVRAFSQSTSGPSGGSFFGANIAVSQEITDAADLVVTGQVGVGEGAPQKAQAITTYHGTRHRLSVALGYGRFTFSRRSAFPKLGQFSISANDTWQVSGPVLVFYGIEFARFTEGATGTSVLPRFGFAVDAGTRTRLFAGLEPGSSSDEQSRVKLESGEIVLAESKPVAFAASGQPIPDRSYRLQFGGEQLLSEKSSIEMMAFFDAVSGHGVGLLTVPSSTSAIEPRLQVEEQAGRTRGVRVVYKRKVNGLVEGAVGYAFGQGQHLDSRGISEPAHMFSSGLFHVFSAKVDANFVRSGTRLSTVLRFAPNQAVFAIDPFQGQMTTFDPNVSVSFAQSLPSPGFVPGHLEAVIDLRNLLDQQASVSDERQEMIASRYNRLVRVGLSLRF